MGLCLNSFIYLFILYSPIVTHEDQEAKYLNTKMHEQPLCCIRVYPNEGLVEMRVSLTNLS